MEAEKKGFKRTTDKQSCEEIDRIDKDRIKGSGDARSTFVYRAAQSPMESEKYQQRRR